MPFDERAVDKAITVILQLAEQKSWKILRAFYSQSIVINGTVFAGDNARLIQQTLDRMLGELGYISQNGDSTFLVTQKGIEAWSLRKESCQSEDEDY